ncbi:MAG: hypothetical protein ACTHOF_03290 [Flavisolibacter sp.]|jgi:hypothetical protein
MKEKQLSEHESLRLITEMIQKAKQSFHEDGTSAILWGTVVAVCGLVNFAELYWNFSIGFDIWLLTLLAIVPQIFIEIRENKQRRVVTHMEAAMNAIWLVYGISIFALVFYMNVVPYATDSILANEGTKLFQTTSQGTQPFHYFIASAGSLLLLIYAIPTLATGIAYKFGPMFWAAILCYIFFIISCFVPTAYDMLLNGLAGIFNWLIPGLILRSKFKRQKMAVNV